MQNKRKLHNILVTGGAGFIGCNFIHYLFGMSASGETGFTDSGFDGIVVNADALTYAGNLSSLKDIDEKFGSGATDESRRYFFEKLDICERKAVERVFREYNIDTVVHFAAESHVDRSIDSAGEFIQTNIVGTFNLLEAARAYWQQMSSEKRETFRFHHISTDEVYGDLHGTDDLFTETTPYAPSSPYSASKASSDHLVRAWLRTYGLPTIVTNCSNNYGPYHFPEKLIPLMILNALDGKPLPVYGDGMQIRDWLFVEDHARALYQVVTEGVVGETYNIGGHNEKANIEVVKTICALLEELVPEKPAGVARYEDLITFVQDRPGHDVRYAIDAAKIGRELGWKPQETFESGIRKTVQWYLNNKTWWQNVLNGSYRLERLGKL